MDYIDKFDVNNVSIKKLLESINNNKRLILFVGAGISKLCGLPLWSDFAVKLANECYKDGYINFQTMNDYVAFLKDNPKMLITIVFEKYREKNDEERYFLHFKKLLSADANTESTKLLEFVKRMQADVITTNADIILDECAKSDSRIFFGSTLLGDFELSTNNLGPLIIHLHGSVTNRESLIFTVSDYLKLYSKTNDKFAKNMNMLLNDPVNTILFIGTSMSEMELLQYMIKKDEISYSKFILNGFFNKQLELEKSLYNYYRNCFGITQISFSLDSVGYDNILSFLDNLSYEVSISTNVVAEQYEETIKTINTKNPRTIVDELIYRSNSVSRQIFHSYFDYINQCEFASDIFRLLYDKRPDFFDIGRFNYKSRTIQNIVISNFASCTNFNKTKQFIHFINKYLSYLEEKLNDDFELISSFNIVYCYLKFINMNPIYNSRKIYQLLKNVKEKKAPYFSEYIGIISNINIRANTVYNIGTLLISVDNNSGEFDAYCLDTFFKTKLNTIIEHDAIGFFKAIRNNIIKTINKHKLAYSDMGAICDYINDTPYFSLEKYLIKVLKSVIKKMNPNDALAAFKLCQLMPIDKKIKLYIADIHFPYINKHIYTELIDGKDSFASIAWLIKHHREELVSNSNLKKYFLSVIDDCKYEGENENDAKYLKDSLKSFITNESIEILRASNSKYVDYGFNNIGKYFWSSTLDAEKNTLYAAIENMSVMDLSILINQQKRVPLELEDAISKYFDSEKSVSSLIVNPNIFISIKHDELVYPMLHSICVKNNQDVNDISFFLESVLKKTINKTNAWIWLLIIENNNLELNVSISLLNLIFDCLNNNDYSIDLMPVHFTSDMINNSLYSCVKLLIEKHCLNNDSFDFVKSILNLKNDKNFKILLSAISSSYSYLFNDNPNVLSEIEAIISTENTDNLVCFFNCLIFSNIKLVKKFIFTKRFAEIFPVLSIEAKEFFGINILTRHTEFDRDLVIHIAKNITFNYCETIIDNYVNNGFGDLELIINILSISFEQKSSISCLDKIILLLLKNISHPGLRAFSIKIFSNEQRYIDWLGMKDNLISLLQIDESFCVFDIFIPLSEKYIEKNYLYMDDDFYPIFDEIFNNSKSNDSKIKLVKLAKAGFQLGLLKLKKYK